MSGREKRRIPPVREESSVKTFFGFVVTVWATMVLAFVSVMVAAPPDDYSESAKVPRCDRTVFFYADRTEFDGSGMPGIKQQLTG